MKGKDPDGDGRSRPLPPPESPHHVLRTLLHEARLTELRLAQLVNKPLRTINRVICGHNRLTVDMAYRLAAPLGTTPERLLAVQTEHDLWLHKQRLARTNESHTGHRKPAGRRAAAANGHACPKPGGSTKPSANGRGLSAER